MFWKVSDKEEQDDAEDSRRSRVFARGYAVFNAAQVDGYPTGRRQACFTVDVRTESGEVLYTVILSLCGRWLKGLEKPITQGSP